MSTSLFRRKRQGPGSPATLRQDVAAALRERPPLTNGVEAFVYWSGAVTLIWIAALIGRVAAADARSGAVIGLLIGLALVVLLLALRHRRFGTVRPPLGRQVPHRDRFEARALRRSLLTPARAGFLVGAAFIASSASGGGESGIPGSALWVIAWTVPLALLYWGLESFLGPVRVNGAHFVLPLPILAAGILLLPDAMPPASVGVLVLAGLAHVALGVVEEL